MKTERPEEIQTWQPSPVSPKEARESIEEVAEILALKLNGGTVANASGYDIRFYSFNPIQWFRDAIRNHSYFRTIAVNSASIPSDLSNFQMLVRWQPPASFYADKELKNKLKSWTYEDSPGEHWVEVPLVSASTDTVLYMAYGGQGWLRRAYEEVRRIILNRFRGSPERGQR